MLNFSSALYLGLRHASHELAPWSQLTMGAPAALVETAAAPIAAAALARLAGCQRGTLARSSLHALLDLVPIFADARTTSILLDAAAYPVSGWGVERAVARGVAVRRVGHYQPDDVWRAARRCSEAGLRPMIVLDGSCPGCGRAAPLAEYLAVVRQFGGRVVVDDTQAFGLAGPEGGGSLRAAIGAASAPALLVASLAKGFGAPLALVAGTAPDIARFVRRSQTRVHLSPPSMADVHAARRAIHINAIEGDARRAHLAGLIRQLQQGLVDLRLPIRIEVGKRLAPVQEIPTDGFSPLAMYDRLLAAGVRGVVHRGCDGRPRLSLIVTAAHAPQHIDQALGAIGAALHCYGRATAG